MLKAKHNAILDEAGQQLAVVLAANIPKSTARRWAQYIVDRVNADERGKAARAVQETAPARTEKCFADCGDSCQCERYQPKYCKSCANSVDQCTCAAMETGAVPPPPAPPAKRVINEFAPGFGPKETGP